MKMKARMRCSKAEGCQKRYMITGVMGRKAALNLDRGNKDLLYDMQFSRIPRFKIVFQPLID
jgi:hypothetical protein